MHLHKKGQLNENHKVNSPVWFTEKKTNYFESGSKDWTYTKAVEFLKSKINF